MVISFSFLVIWLSWPQVINKHIVIVILTVGVRTSSSSSFPFINQVVIRFRPPLSCWWHRIFLRPPARAPLWTRTIVADGHNYSAVRRFNRRFLGRSKNAIVPIPPAFGAHLVVLSSEFRRGLLHHKTKSFGFISVIIRLAVLIQYRLADGQTDGRTDRSTDTRWQLIPCIASRG